MSIWCLFDEDLRTEAWMVPTGVSQTGSLLAGRQPAAGLVQHGGRTECLCQLDPVTARELPLLKLQVPLVQHFKFQFWVIMLKNLMYFTLHLSMRVVAQRYLSNYSPISLGSGVEEDSTHCEGCFVWEPDADLPQGWWAQLGVYPLCRLKLFLHAKPILTEPVTSRQRRWLALCTCSQMERNKFVEVFQF